MRIYNLDAEILINNFDWNFWSEKRTLNMMFDTQA